MPTPKDLFLAALEKPATERAAFLDESCGGDADLRGRVEALLRAHDASDVVPVAGEVTDDPTATQQVPEESTRTFTPGPISEAPGTRIGPYKLLQSIGEGGMGTVFMAEQTEPVRRRVALKVIKAGMDTAQVIARFEAERQALAIMDHPGIARVLDAGTTDSGRPFFVMELVQGVPITRYCDERRIPLRERLELMAGVCQAVQHAHQKGIIHRDIKPSNVLVTEVDGKPVPKVIDFGVAKATNQVLTEKTLFTQFGAIVGTPEYMSPEQAGLGSVDVDTRSDIYSLGVLLYELLTGSTPLRRESLREAAFTEVLRRIKEEEPATPSSRLATTADGLPSVAAQRNTDPSRLTRLVRGELDWIVMKALEKDRTRRYETATGFAKDIHRYLDGDPVEASPPSATYKLRKFARRHRASLATAGAFALLLLAATVTSTTLALWANQERTRAQDREQVAIDAVKRFGDVIRETPELKDEPSLAPLRARLLKEPQAFFRRLRDQLQSERSTTPASLDRLASASDRLSDLTSDIGDKQDALRISQESLAIRERLARDYPDVEKYQSDLAAAYGNTGILLHATGERAEALRAYRAGLAISEKLADANPSDSTIQREIGNSYHNIGVFYHDDGLPNESMAAYEAALTIRRKLADAGDAALRDRLNVSKTLNAIGYLLARTGRPTDAIAAYQEALSIQTPLAEANSVDVEIQSALAQVQNNLSLVLFETGHNDQALASITAARDTYQRLAQANPSLSKFKFDLARSHNNIGIHLENVGASARALESYRAALGIAEPLSAANPSVVEYQNLLAIIHYRIGSALHETNPDEALEAYRAAIAIQEMLLVANPDVPETESSLASSHHILGHLLSSMGRPSAAMEEWNIAAKIQERLARSHPEVPEYATLLGITLNNMARQDFSDGRTADAILKLKQAISSQSAALKATPANPYFRQYLEGYLRAMIELARVAGNDEEVAAAQRGLRELEPRDPGAPESKAGPREDGDEGLQTAKHAYEGRLFARSARLFAQALESDPTLADDRQTQHRYNAACAAALAGCGKARDNPPPDDAAMTKLRRQSLDWLKAELAAWQAIASTGEPEQRQALATTLQHWKADADLAGIRDEAELAKLPEAERDAWQALWAEVDGLLHQVDVR